MPDPEGPVEDLRVASAANQESGTNPAAVATPAPVLMVEYAGPLNAELTHRQRRLATSAAWFGGIPLALGCLDFLLWVPTRGEVFMIGGLIVILMGLILTFVGGLLLLILLCSMQGSGKFKLFFRTSRLAIFLLLVNYPVAFGIILIVAKMMDPGF